MMILQIHWFQENKQFGISDKEPTEIAGLTKASLKRFTSLLEFQLWSGEEEACHYSNQKCIIDFPFSAKGEKGLQAFVNTVDLKQDSRSENYIYNKYKRDWPARKTAT